MSKDITNKIKLLVSLSVIPLVSYLIVFLVKYFKPNIIGLSKLSALILNEVIFLSAFLVIIILFKDLFIRSISLLTEKKPRKFKNLFEKTMESFGIFFVIKLGVGLVVSLLLTLLGKDTMVENQALIESYVDVSKILLFVSAVLIGPLCEEFIFRGAIKEGIKNKWVFITVSGLIFGLMHVLDGYTLLLCILLIGLYLDIVINKYKGKERVYLSICGVLIISLLCGCVLYFQYGNLIQLLLHINATEALGGIVYITMGFVLAHMYYKSNNIWINVGVHTLNNLLGVLSMLFL